MIALSLLMVASTALSGASVRSESDAFVRAVLSVRPAIDRDALREHRFPLCPAKGWSDEIWTSVASGVDAWSGLYEHIDAMHAMPEAQSALERGSSFPWPTASKLMTVRHIVNMLCIRSALAAHRGDTNTAIESLAEALDFNTLLGDGSAVYVLIEAACVSVEMSTLEVIAASRDFELDVGSSILPRLERARVRLTKSRSEIRSLLQDECERDGRPQVGGNECGLNVLDEHCRSAVDRIVRAQTALVHE
jgi:hypothetical protein